MSVSPITLERADRVRFEALPPLAVYVHLPWCLRKCPYCDFNSHAVLGNSHAELDNSHAVPGKSHPFPGAELPEAEYVDALVADLEGLLPSVWGRRVTSVFIGGGTPSLFSPEAIERLLSALRARLVVEPGAEVTLEANPGASDAARFAGYRAAGVNRLSLGVQSFSDAKLAAIGRVHDAAGARRALEAALAHFDNVNVDLMYGLPGQTLAEARADLDAATGYAPAHISAYQLTIEPNTAFYGRPPQLPDHDACAEMQLAAEAALAAAGYGHYETSAFARPGRRSRHNLNYWEFGDYLGLGAGAHGKLSFADRVVRHARIKAPRDYLAAAPRGASLAEERVVAAAEMPFEFMLNALRLIDGFPIELFPARTGLPLAALARGLEEAEQRGFVVRDAARIRPTERGRRFLNEALEIFLPAAR